MKLINLGIILIGIGFLLVLISSLKNQSKIESAGGIFIGPFPLFGWGTNKEIFYILIGLTIFLFIIQLIFNRLS